MCFSANANFIASAGIAIIGVATLRHVRQPRAVLFAAVPLLFALHQFTEGFVWLGVDKLIRGDAEGHVAFLFILYAQGILPFLMPLAVLLMEPPGRRRTIVAVLTALGAVLCAYVFYGLIVDESHVRVLAHSLNYENPETSTWWVALIYVVATCGALVASSHRVVRWFGILNLVGVVATLAIKSYAFTSIWCLYAAIISVMIYWQFSRRHIDIGRPNSRLDGLQEVLSGEAAARPA